MLDTASTPKPPSIFQQGMLAFEAKQRRHHNPFVGDGMELAFVEWDAGYSYAVSQNIEQPQHNAYATQVYVQVMTLAQSFEDNQYYVAASELRALASRGPSKHWGVDHFSSREVLGASSERVAEMERMAAQDKKR